MATRAKSRAGKPRASSSKAVLKKLMMGVDATAKKRGVPMFDLQAFEDTYGVKFYISTGMPDFDIMTMQNKDNNQSGRKPYGFPTGRIVELCGNEASYKTWMTHQISSRVRKMGGLVFLIQTENDFDLSFYRRFYDSKGLDFDTEVKPYVRAVMATTLGELREALKSIIPSIKAHYDESPDVSFPTVIVLDSLGAMFSTENKENYDADNEKGDRMGGSAKEIHDLMKSLTEPCGRYNIMFLMTNHFRANLGGGMKQQKPAHDSAVKYYASFRSELKSWNKKGAKKTSLGQDYMSLKVLNVNITKKRGDFVGDSKLEVGVFPQHGFDYLGSLINALRLTGVAKQGAKFVFTLDPESGIKYEKELFDKITELGKIEMKNTEVRDFLKENMTLVPKLEYVLFEHGPRQFQQIDEEEIVS